MNSDIEIAKIQAYEARQNINYAIAGYRYLGKDPSHLYEMRTELDRYVPVLEKNIVWRNESSNLGFVQIPLLAWAGLTAAIAYVSAVWQKSWTERVKTECEIKKLELIEQGKLSPEDLSCDLPSDSVGDTLDKIRGIIVIGAGAAALIAILGFLKKK